MEKGYNLREASEALGIKVRTVREWIRTGKLNAIKLEGTNRWVIMETEIARMQGRKVDDAN